MYRSKTTLFVSLKCMYGNAILDISTLSLNGLEWHSTMVKTHVRKKVALTIKNKEVWN